MKELTLRQRYEFEKSVARGQLIRDKYMREQRRLKIRLIKVGKVKIVSNGQFTYLFYKSRLAVTTLAKCDSDTGRQRKNATLYAFFRTVLVAENWA